MFTGIVTHIGTIESAEQQGDLRIKISSDLNADTLRIGDSIACNGACLTLTGKGFLASGKVYFTAELSAETITRTVPGQWHKGCKVNLERSLRIGDTLDGHMVSGHIDATASIHNITSVGDSHTLEIEIPADLSRYIAQKGSVTLDGVSLTVNHVEGQRFWVNIIAHTWHMTTLGERKAGDQMNLEIDLIARYIERQLTGRTI